MSHFECPLNRRFWRSKKVVQVVQKEQQLFFRETLPNLVDTLASILSVIQISTNLHPLPSQILLLM